MNHKMSLVQKICCAKKAALLSVLLFSIPSVLFACASFESDHGPYPSVSPGSLGEEEAVEEGGDAEAIARIAWIDTRASHIIVDPKKQYPVWNVRCGLSVQIRDDAQKTTKAAYRDALGAGIGMSPKGHLEVQHINGSPVEIAVHVRDRYDRPGMLIHPGALSIWRDLSEEDGWTTYIGAARVALGEEPEPGVYQMRLKAEGWSADIYDGIKIDESWQTFIITEVGDESTPVESLPWYDLPKQPNHPEYNKKDHRR